MSAMVLESRCLKIAEYVVSPTSKYFVSTYHIRMCDSVGRGACESRELNVSL